MWSDQKAKISDKQNIIERRNSTSASANISYDPGLYTKIEHMRMLRWFITYLSTNLRRNRCPTARVEQTHCNKYSLYDLWQRLISSLVAKKFANRLSCEFYTHKELIQNREKSAHATTKIIIIITIKVDEVTMYEHTLSLQFHSILLRIYDIRPMRLVIS